MCGIVSIPSQWEVSCGTAYSPWHFVPRKHVSGQRQGPGWLMSLRNNSLIKWIGARVTSSAHFMNSPRFANASQSDAAATTGALSVHPSHISKWRSMLKDMGQRKAPELSPLRPFPSLPPFIFWRKIQAVIRGAKNLWQFFTMTQHQSQYQLCENGLNSALSSCNTLHAGYSKIQ